jgi:hypothetical protein
MTAPDSRCQTTLGQEAMKKKIAELESNIKKQEVGWLDGWTSA